MIEESRDAIRKILATKFTEITRIYIDNSADEIVKPSFFLVHSNFSTKQISQGLIEKRVNWQIYYFEKEDDAGNVSRAEQHKILEKLQEVFFEGRYLKSENGEIFFVTEVTGNRTSEDEIYLNLELYLHTRKAMSEFDNTDYKLGDIKFDLGLK